MRICSFFGFQDFFTPLSFFVLFEMYIFLSFFLCVAVLFVCAYIIYHFLGDCNI